jgi:hypothetical protein
MDRGMYLAVRAHSECRGTEDLLPVYQGDMVPGADAVNVDVGVATCAPYAHRRRHRTNNDDDTPEDGSSYYCTCHRGCAQPLV